LADEIQVGDRVQALFVPYLSSLHGESGTVVAIDELRKPLRATLGRYTVRFDVNGAEAYVVDVHPLGKRSLFRRFIDWVSA
jgi:hypothetical protein